MRCDYLAAHKGTDMQEALETVLEYINIPIPAPVLVAALVIAWLVLRWSHKIDLKHVNQKHDIEKQEMRQASSGMEQRLKTIATERDEQLRSKDEQLRTKENIIELLKTALEYKTSTTYLEKVTDTQPENRIFVG